MIYALVVTLSVLWITRILWNLLSYVALWYVKEYRFDRMAIHLGTQQGREILFIPFHRPPRSPKAIALFFITTIALGALYVALPWQHMVKLLLVDLVSFPVTAVVVFCLNIPTLIYHEIVIARAVQKFRRHAPMTVIGVTGSFGKTSTKEFIAAMLATKYSVLKTRASRNSPIAIAETILRELTSDTQVFVVEMGAYKRGEIAKMCRMVTPRIGVVTAINAQHQDLFGSIDETKKAKYELIAGLTGTRIAIINLDNVHTKEMAGWAKESGADVRLFSTNDAMKLPFAADAYRAKRIRQEVRGVLFDIVYKKKTLPVAAPIVGVQFVSNVVAAIAASVSAGMTLEEAVKAVKTIRLPQRTMEITANKDGVTLINDTFNNNPDAARASLMYLKAAKGKKKIMVFTPMIELGKYASISHREIGVLAAGICDEVILTNHNYQGDFVSGLSDDQRQHVHVFSAQDAASFLRHVAGKGDVILFKSKESERVFKLVNA